jgi:hypothetical protein
VPVDHFARNEVENLLENDHIGAGWCFFVHITLPSGRDFNLTPARFLLSTMNSCGMAVKTNRRNFLQKAGCVSLGITLFPTIIKSSALGRQGHVPPSDRINLVLIGCGGQGRWNTEQILKLDDVQVIAVCDVDQSQSALAKRLVDEKYGNTGCRIYGDFREILEKEKGDAAILALPDHWHALIAIAEADKTTPISPALRSGHRLLQRPSPEKQFPSNIAILAIRVSPAVR